MTHLRLLKRLSVFLVLLLLANSSLALEVLTHDAHQHADSYSGELAGHAMHGMPEADQLSSTNQASAQGRDDCICDDICCLTSIDLGLATLDEQFVSEGESQAINPNFYLSVSLDLFLPPPTR